MTAIADEIVEVTAGATERIGLIQVELLKGSNFFELKLAYQDGKKRDIVSETFDMTDKRRRRAAIFVLMEALSYCVQKKVWPADTRIYRTVTTPSGVMKNEIVGWPEDLTEEQRVEFHVNGN